MGLPYSKQINAAFNQVTPLVAAGFEVLETTKNIAILLAWIEVLTVVILSLILAALAALLVTMNPDLEEERKTLVTPVMKWLARSVLHWMEFAGTIPRTVITILGAFGLVVVVALWWTAFRGMRDEEMLTMDEIDNNKAADEEAQTTDEKAEKDSGNQKKK